LKKARYEDEQVFIFVYF